VGAAGEAVGSSLRPGRPASRSGPGARPTSRGLWRQLGPDPGRARGHRGTRRRGRVTGPRPASGGQGQGEGAPPRGSHSGSARSEVSPGPGRPASRSGPGARPTSRGLWRQLEPDPGRTRGHRGTRRRGRVTGPRPASGGPGPRRRGTAPWIAFRERSLRSVPGAGTTREPERPRCPADVEGPVAATRAGSGSSPRPQGDPSTRTGHRAATGERGPRPTSLPWPPPSPPPRPRAPCGPRPSAPRSSPAPGTPSRRRRPGGGGS